MSLHQLPSGPGADDDPRAPARRPRIALMGEFSAGKSTLANLLVGTDRLPVQVTATELPPIWLTQGDGAMFRVDRDGQETPLDPEDLHRIPLSETAYVRMGLQAPLLARCDLIDMPGISDPNMPVAFWQDLLPRADAVLWCTHATQAWRQSEAAVWETVAEPVRARSLLLVTRIDKIASAQDRVRLLRRLGMEAADLFARPPIPVSLLRAMAGRDSPRDWQESGAADLMSALEGVLCGLESGAHSGVGDAPAERAAGLAPDPGGGASGASAPAGGGAAVAEGSGDAPGGVVPRRISLSLSSGSARTRPPRDEDDPDLLAFRALIRDRKG